MHVAGIIPILLNIISSEQQNQKNAARPSQANQTGQLNQPSPTATLTAGAANNIKPASAQLAGQTHESVLLPLPLKTALFPETQFYVFQKQPSVDDQHQQQSQEKAAGVAFSIGTAKLGRLFFTLNQQNDTMRIDCYAERPMVVSRLRSLATTLESDISAIGFTKVVFKPQILDRHSDSEQTGFTYTGLLDIKI